MKVLRSTNEIKFQIWGEIKKSLKVMRAEFCFQGFMEGERGAVRGADPQVLPTMVRSFFRCPDCCLSTEWEKCFSHKKLLKERLKIDFSKVATSILDFLHHNSSSSAHRILTYEFLFFKAKVFP